MANTNPQLVVHQGGGAERAATEPELVARARQGEMHAWGVLYQAYFPRVYRHVRFMVGSETGAEDLVQEAFARALVRLPDFDGRSSFSTWLHGIAVNVVRNHWRARRNTETAHERLRNINAARGGEMGPAADHAHLCKRKAEVVYAILETLPEHMREAFILRDLQGCSPAEAAARLGISPGNLSVRASRARERIRKELERMGWMQPREGQA